MNTNQTIANRFTIRDPEKDLLGRGGMGDVYRALDKQTGETVAVKALNPAVLDRDPTLLERFVRESNALRQLNHPNIVHMVAAVEENGQHYLVMEFVEGGSLKDVLSSQNTISAERTIEINLDLADALTRAHRLGIIHRDLKPANVLLAKDGTPRLADFGIAHVQESTHITQTGVLIGTVDYLSPEVCQGDPPNELSDIWAFGVMMFEMLSGKLPFEGKSMTAKITAILHQPVPDLSKLVQDIPDALVDLVYRMLEKDSHQRVPSVRLVAAELEGILKGRKPASSGVATSFPSSAFEDTSISGRPVFVGREQELKQLDKALGKTLAGHGQVAFIIGDPGQGKTALLQEFGRRAQKTHAGLVVASGNCNAYTGIGDPYLPFREIMGMLTGDVETLKEAGVIGQTQANRLWHTFPFAVQYLIESGNNLVDIFVSGADLLQRATSVPAWADHEKWLPQLEQLVARKASQTGDANLQQAALFEQFVRMVRALANHAPLILLLDDLQWADSGSINLLLHLGKRLEGNRVMVVGAYRPTDVALGRTGERHPLEPVINEFKRQFGEIQIDLSQAEGRAFVNSFLDTEPNHLDDVFRQEFFRFSGGHPLMMVELLRDLQERGGLVKDTEGYWIIGSALNWETLPVRVEATIAERMERLDKQELAILRVAGVQGETFSAEVVSRVLSLAEPEVVTQLSSNLDREHHLVSAQGIRQVNEQRVSFYKFRHILFQKYLYNSLDPVERAHIHQQVGTTLQALYGKEDAEIAVQLARHFQEAGTTGKAADYLSQAGDHASSLVAYQEAVDHYEQAKIAYESTLGKDWNPLQRAILERKIGEAFFKNGDYKGAAAHLNLALTFLKRDLPKTTWQIYAIIVVETLVQICHRFLPGFFVKQPGKPISPRVEEEIKINIILGYIFGWNKPVKFLMITLRTLNIAEREGHADGIGVGSMGLGIAIDFIPIFSLSEHYHRIAVKVAEQVQHLNVLNLAYMGLAHHQQLTGRLDDAIKYAKKGADICQKIDDLSGWDYSAGILSVTLYYQGKLSQSLIFCREWVRKAQEVANLEIECHSLCTIGGLLRRLGDMDEAIATLERSIELALAIPAHSHHVAAGGDLGRCYLSQSKLAEALSVLHASQQIYFQYGAGWGADIPLLNGLTEAYLNAAEHNDPAEKDDWLKKAKVACKNALKRSAGFRAALAEAMRLQGTYEWLRGRPAAAQKWWQRSLALAEKMGQRYDLGMTHLEIGKRLGDKNHLEQAQTIFTEIGAEWDLKQAQQALEKL